jgi:HD-like signal output (HDOD) protein
VAGGGREVEPLTIDDDLQWVHRRDGGRSPAPVRMPASAVRAGQAQAEADAIVQAWEDAVLGGPAQHAAVGVATQPASAPRDPAEILHQSGDLPAMPRAALHILSVIEDPRTTATRLEKAVAMDQALTAKILRIANSPFYGAVREISTVSEAIVRLGFVTIRNWTLVTATKSVFLGAGAGVLFQKIWRQSVLSAMAAQLVAQTVRRAEPETVFVGGLMQNIGQLVLARSQPELFQQVLTISAAEALPYHLVEQELLGFDHGDLGALLIKEWNLSEELEQAVRWHHRLDHPDVQCRDLAALVALGEEVAACTGSADVEDEDTSSWHRSPAAIALGLSSELCQRLRGQATELTLDPGLFT